MFYVRFHVARREWRSKSYVVSRTPTPTLVLIGLLWIGGAVTGRWVLISGVGHWHVHTPGTVSPSYIAGFLFPSFTVISPFSATICPSSAVVSPPFLVVRPFCVSVISFVTIAVICPTPSGSPVVAVVVSVPVVIVVPSSSSSPPVISSISASRCCGGRS